MKHADSDGRPLSIATTKTTYLVGYAKCWMAFHSIDCAPSSRLPIKAASRCDSDSPPGLRPLPPLPVTIGLPFILETTRKKTPRGGLDPRGVRALQATGEAWIFGPDRAGSAPGQ
jgi:hypothetical protein